jgi:Na+/phosphate symporter
MKLSMYKKILQVAKKNHAEKICQIEWRIKIIETYERAIEDYKQNPEIHDLTNTEKTQLEKEFDHADEFNHVEEEQTSENEIFHELTDTERRLGLNNPAVYKPFLANLKNLRRPPDAAKPVSRTEYHINSDDGDDDSTEIS